MIVAIGYVIFNFIVELGATNSWKKATLLALMLATAVLLGAIAEK